MTSVQARLEVEVTDLSEKSDKLYSFIYCSDIYDTLDGLQRDLLKDQLKVMREYERILRERKYLL